MLEEDIEQIVVSHNLTPRKVLGGLSPIEVLAKKSTMLRNISP